MNKLKYVDGNLITMALDDEFEVIAHGCNCFCSMGAGIAKQIKNEWPGAYEVDLRTATGNKKKLGTYSVFRASKPDLYIVNMYTQFKPQPPVNYSAIRSCMKKLRKTVQEWNPRIGLPMIGAGLAKGDWNKIEKIIEEELLDFGLDVTIVKYKQN